MPRTIVGSWSEVDAARQCPHKWKLAFVERWSRDGGSEALKRGSSFHLVMEQHSLAQQRFQQSRRPDKDKLLAEIVEARELILRPLEDGTEDERARGELVRWMHEGYLAHHGAVPEWEILHVEKAFEHWLPTPRGGRSNIRLRGRADLVVRWKGRVWLVDHKTCKDLPRDKDLAFADQFGVYVWLLRRSGTPVFGVLHDAVRTLKLKTKVAPLEERFKRTPSYRTDAELDTIAVEAYETLAGAHSPRNRGERNPDEDRCGWRCDFTESCLHGRKTSPEQERDYMLSAGYQQRTELQMWLDRGYSTEEIKGR